jgi:hypothetical protein
MVATAGVHPPPLPRCARGPTPAMAPGQTVGTVGTVGTPPPAGTADPAESAATAEAPRWPRVATGATEATPPLPVRVAQAAPANRAVGPPVPPLEPMDRMGPMAVTADWPAVGAQRARGAERHPGNPPRRAPNPKVLPGAAEPGGVSRDFNVAPTTLSSTTPGRLHRAGAVNSRNVGLVARRCGMVLNPRHDV